MKTKFVEQECNECGKNFVVEYSEDGSYIYIEEPCECESDFSPINGEPSLSEWLLTIKRKDEVSNMKRGTKLVCIKQMKDYREENAIDFYKNKEYEIVSCDNDEIYVESEDGSDVLFDINVDFYDYFKLTI